MGLFKKKIVKKTYDREYMKPVIRASICTGEEVAGFKDIRTGKIEEIMLIRSPEDLERFKEISPEAAVGGPIALIEEGDIISINIPELKLEVKVSDEEMAARKAKWQPREPRVTTGYLARYAAMVTSGNRGAILEVPKAK